MITFRDTAEEHLGAKLNCAKLEEVGIHDTPKFTPYAGRDQNKSTFLDLDEEVTPEVGDEYVHASVMLLHGSQMMHGTFKTCKKDLVVIP